MRDNGLTAGSYVALADLDPRIADTMLELLREQEIAAYAEPHVGTRGPFLEVRTPTAPCDRLHVDGTRAREARVLLDDHLPRLREELAAPDDRGRETGVDAAPSDPVVDTALRAREDLSSPGSARTKPPASSSDDETWAALVAAYHDDSPRPIGPWPAQEDVAERAPEPVEPARPGGPSEEPGDDRGGRPGPRPPVAQADDEHYVPPPPPPLPQLDRITKVAWAGLGGGPLLLLLTVATGWYVPDWLLVAAVVAFGAGFVTLVWRAKGHDPDGGDSGAVV